MATDELKRNITSVTERVMRAATHAGSAVTIVAASKTVPADIINSAVEYGIKNIGENRVQEFRDKKDAVIGAKWHFIGTLQRNKAKYLVGNVALVQSVNCAGLASEIDRLAKARGVVQDVLVEVNVANEHGKTGAPVAAVDELVAYARSLENLRVRGLMSVPPKDAEESAYSKLGAIYARYRDADFDTLSVGMSGDFERAIANGSNMVRIGTAIFGRRTQ